jgi:hypothetical protein
MKMAKAITSKIRQAALKRGFRSGLEDKIADQIKGAGHEVLYETEKILYVIPERIAKYTPDFKLPKANGGFFYVETKGRWVAEDRAKSLFIQKQHPEIDIRLVFSNQNQKIYKGSPTSYADYCIKHGLTFANKWIPKEWLVE